MKYSIKLLLACVILFATSCKKDDNLDKISTTVDEVKTAIVNGYWQLEQVKSPGANNFVTEEYYDVNKYYDNDEYDQYFVKSEKYNESPWYYKIKTVDNKTALVRYSNFEDYQKDVYRDYRVFYIVIEGKKMTLSNKDDGRVYIFYNFASISATKDKKIGS